MAALQPVILLIPTSLGAANKDFFPESIMEQIRAVDLFLVENERSARRFLRSIGYQRDFAEVPMIRLEADETFNQDPAIGSALGKATFIGVLSEAGCPGIADPGSAVARWAHRNFFRVIPLPGPSSIFLALMASGLNGQQFAFHGYLPVAAAERKLKLKMLEEESGKKKQAQIFMETPYRNDSLFRDMLSTLKPHTLVCVAANLTLAGERISTRTVSAWKNQPWELHKQPAVFLLQAGQ